MGASGTRAIQTVSAWERASTYSCWKTLRRLVFERGSKATMMRRPG
jgi:hypothetical protein